MIRRWIFVALVGLELLSGLVPVAAGPPGALQIVPIAGTIDESMAHMVERAVGGAAVRGARAIVLDVDSSGGLVSAGTEIRHSLSGSQVPVYAYVSRRAWSTGALVTLAATKIAMAPGSSIGVKSALDDAGLDAWPDKAAGAILMLTAEAAARSHFGVAVAPTLRDALASFGLAGVAVERAKYTFAEDVARCATNPDVSGLLLSIGFLGLLIEMQTLRGVAGTIGVAAFALFFGTHVHAGFSNRFVIALGLSGALAILFELHVLPGQGIAGRLGLAALLAAIVLAFGFAFVFAAIAALAIAIVLTALCFALATRVYRENAFLARLGCAGPDDAASAGPGELLGQTGIASSYLRPAGVATIDGNRVDVLSEGEFVTAGTAIRVTRVEGARVFVGPRSRDRSRLRGGAENPRPVALRER